jgi:hypothetical protein
MRVSNKHTAFIFAGMKMEALYSFETLVGLSCYQVHGIITQEILEIYTAEKASSLTERNAIAFSIKRGTDRHTNTAVKKDAFITKQCFCS